MYYRLGLSSCAAQGVPSYLDSKFNHVFTTQSYDNAMQGFRDTLRAWEIHWYNISLSNSVFICSSVFLPWSNLWISSPGILRAKLSKIGTCLQPMWLNFERWQPDLPLRPGKSTREAEQRFFQFTLVGESQLFAAGLWIITSLRDEITDG